MSTKLYNGVCNQDRYNKFIKIVADKWKKMGSNAPKPVTTAQQALADPNLRRYFERQRIQINSYYQQARKESRKKYGDIVRDIKSLLVPYLFAMNDYKPGNDFKKFSHQMGNANKYFINNIISSFKPSLRPTKRRNRIIPFNSQLDSWWGKNKSSQLSGWMTIINQSPASVLAQATAEQAPSMLKAKAESFKEALKQIRAQKRTSTFNKIPVEEMEIEDEEGRGGGGGLSNFQEQINQNSNAPSSNISSSSSSSSSTSIFDE